MAAFVDKENIAPAYNPYEYVNRNPLDMLSDAKHELDADYAVGVQKRVARDLAREKELSEKAGRALAIKLHIEEHDAALAQQIHAADTAKQEEIKLQRRKSVAEDERVAQALAEQLSKEAAKEADAARTARQKIAASDAELAAKLQAAEGKRIQQRVEELKWTNPTVTVTQHESSVRFAVKLPGLAHANVSIHHQQNGDATLAIEAIPVSAVNATPKSALQPINPLIDTKEPAQPPALQRRASVDRRDAIALQNFLFDFKLTSSTPLQIDAKDITVSYDEKSEELQILCSNLKLNEQQKQSFVDKLKSFFGGKKNQPSTNGKK